MEYSGHIVYELVRSSVVLGNAEYLKAYIYIYIDIVIEPHNIPVILVAIESVTQTDTSCEASIDLEADENPLDKYRIASNEIS